ncbi:hypothetical protein GCM10025879_05610 [Leuconostoc litchii]|nr:hypothetical protein GCM10025879_05610 [Leuconostoc litchii]
MEKSFFKGNHDHSDQLKAALKAPETNIIEYIETAKAMKIDGINVWLSHYAIDLPYPILSIHGHIHEAEYKQAGMVNLSLDSFLMQQRRFGQPISFEELHIELKKD